MKRVTISRGCLLAASFIIVLSLFIPAAPPIMAPFYLAAFLVAVPGIFAGPRRLRWVAVALAVLAAVLTVVQIQQGREWAGRMQAIRQAVEEDEEAIMNERLLTGEVRPRNIPEDWKGEPLENGEGWRWFSPTNSGDSVRIYRGGTGTESSQDEPYVVVTVDGEVVGRDGKPTGTRLDN